MTQVDDTVTPAGRPVDDALGVLVETLARFWPDGEVTVESSRTAPRGADTVSFGIAPRLSAPRLLVPTGSRRAAARSLRRFSASASTRDAVTRLGAAGLSGALGAAALPDRIVVRRAGGDSLLAHLGDLLGQPVQVSVGVGNARVNRKPVLQVFDERGRVLGWAKIGDSDQARADLAAEARGLRQVSARAWEHLEVPRVLHESTWQGLSVLVITALAAGATQALRDPWARPEAAMEELSRGFEEPASTLGALRWWEEQRAVLDRLGDPALRARALACHEALEERASGREWRVGAWHGDWTPWNIAVTRDRVRVWDWERFETGVPFGLDGVHHTLNTHTREHGASAASIHAALARPELADDPVLAEVYLLAITVRYLSLAETSRGEHISERGRTTLDVLTGRLGVTA